MTPDIEKLRGLPEKWRSRSWTLSSEQENELIHLLFQYANVDDKTPVLAFIKTCFRQITLCDANELEAAGLPELLADYERLLLERQARERR